MRAFRKRLFIPKCHRNNSEFKQNILIFHPKNFFLKKFWLENFLFLCNFVTKRHRHELSEGWKKFSWCQNHILTLALYSSECGEHVSMSGCEVWTNIDGDRGTNVKIFKTPPPVWRFEITAFVLWLNGKRDVVKFTVYIHFFFNLS